MNSKKTRDIKKIAIIGAGYVGISLAALLASKFKIVIHDIDSKKIELIKKNQSTVKDDLINDYLKENSANIEATTRSSKSYKNADIVIIAVSSDFNETSNSFDTSQIDSVVSDILSENQNSLIVIKSTLPIGHTKFLQIKHNNKDIIFSPEFLREGSALKDNLYPSRIIVGDESEYSEEFSKILADCSNNAIQPILISSSEAESVKLFSNAYLAMRVSFFNEVDTFAISNKLNSENIINGISLDHRIGDSYNNPSFGYGGYCLPKDTKQLESNFKKVPQELISSITKSNKTRKDFIADYILKKKPTRIGFYRLVMKKDSDNFRSSPSYSIIKRLMNSGLDVVLFEPLIKSDSYLDIEIIEDLEEFKKTCDLIATNRLDDRLNDVTHKCFSRDIFKIN